MAEFGGSISKMIDEASRGEVEPDIPLRTTDDGIELEEYQLRPQLAGITEGGKSPSYSIGTS